MLYCMVKHKFERSHILRVPVFSTNIYISFLFHKAQWQRNCIHQHEYICIIFQKCIHCLSSHWNLNISWHTSWILQYLNCILNTMSLLGMNHPIDDKHQWTHHSQSFKGDVKPAIWHYLRSYTTIMSLARVASEKRNVHFFNL